MYVYINTEASQHLVQNFFKRKQKDSMIQDFIITINIIHIILWCHLIYIFGDHSEYGHSQW